MAGEGAGAGAGAPAGGFNRKKALLENVMWKWSPAMLAGWQRRRVRLFAGGLSYAKEKASVEQEVCIPGSSIEGVNLKPWRGAGSVIEVTAYCPKRGPGRVYSFRTLSNDETGVWMEKLRELISMTSPGTHRAKADPAGGRGGGGGEVSSRPESREKGDGEKGDASGYNFVRRMVSKNKIRFQEDGYDLDLTYVTDNIIAMGCPSEGFEEFYRNPMEEVQKFFKSRHEGHYRLYNLCAEKSRQYDPEKFEGAVECFPFKDHNPPPLPLLVEFCKCVDAFLKADERNTAAIHCKAGKGRTGTVIACYFLHCGLVDTAAKAIEAFGQVRTDDGKGITIPSQKRYVGYYEKVLRDELRLRTPAYQITSLKIYTTPNFDTLGGCDPYIMIYRQVFREGQSELATLCSTREKNQHYCKASVVDLSAVIRERRTRVAGDVLVELWDYDLAGDDFMCKFWFNTLFIPKSNTLIFTKDQIDKANQDKKNQFFDQSFKVEITFADFTVSR